LTASAPLFFCSPAARRGAVAVAWFGAVAAVLATVAGPADARPGSDPRAAAGRTDAAADMVALTVCVISADLRVAALQQMQRGAERDEILRAVEQALRDPVYRAHAQRIVNEVYRARPPQVRPYVAERLRDCAAAAARSARPDAADACYELTRIARDVIVARDGGADRAATAAAVGQLARDRGLGAEATRSLVELAGRAWDAREPAPQFRAGLFYHCVVRGPGS
jgi:hypothetical protein